MFSSAAQEILVLAKKPCIKNGAQSWGSEGREFRSLGLKEASQDARGGARTKTVRGLQVALKFR